VAKKITDPQTIHLLQKRDAFPCRGEDQREALRKRRKIRRAADKKGETIKENLNRDERRILIEQINKWMRNARSVHIRIGPCAYSGKILQRAKWKPGAKTSYICKIRGILEIGHFVTRNDFRRMPLPGELVLIPWHMIRRQNTYSVGDKCLHEVIPDDHYEWAKRGEHRKRARDGDRWFGARVYRRLPFKGDLILLRSGRAALVLEDALGGVFNIPDPETGMPQMIGNYSVNKIIKRHTESRGES